MRNKDKDDSHDSEDSDQDGETVVPNETERTAGPLAATTRRTDRESNYFLTSDRTRLRKRDDDIKRYDQVELFKKVTENDMRAAAVGDLAAVFRN